MTVPSKNIGNMHCKLEDMEKAGIIMRLLLDLLRVEKGKCRVIVEYDPDTGMMNARREEITAAEERTG